MSQVARAQFDPQTLAAAGQRFSGRNRVRAMVLDGVLSGLYILQCR